MSKRILKLNDSLIDLDYVIGFVFRRESLKIDGGVEEKFIVQVLLKGYSADILFSRLLRESFNTKYSGSDLFEINVFNSTQKHLEKLISGEISIDEFEEYQKKAMEDLVS